MNRGSVADPVARLGVILVGAAALFTGCAGLARWEPAPLRLAEVRCGADVGPGPEFAAAPLGRADRESRGFGLNAGVIIAPLGGTGARATVDAQYSDVFENGFGFGASVILRRPAAGTVSVGDIYLLGGVEFVTFTGRVYGGGWVDNASIISLWLDAKTMLAPVGASGAWKPYALCGAGIVMIPEVTYAGGWVMNESSIELGLRGKIGIERRTGKLGLYVDVGIQMNTAPDAGPSVGDAEPMVYTPIGAGVILNF